MASSVLGVDFGTSHTVAVLRRGEAAGVPLLFDGSPLLPSAVYAEADGTLLTGRDALHSARLRPERFEPNPKRRVDDGTVLLGDNEVPVVTLFAEVLAQVRAEAERVAGTPVTSMVVTHPATWGPVRRLVLTDACTQAGLGEVTLVPEPVAAARYFASQAGTEIAPGQAVVVYDFGGGTFDATVLTASDTDFDVLAVDGADDLGGVDIDHALSDHIGQRFDGDDRWSALMRPSDVTGRRHFRTFMDDVRATKERLSRQSRVELLVPTIDVDTHLTREELEAVCEPLLGRAVRLTEAVMRSTGVPHQQVAGVFLVGGASRMPLAATTLHRGIDIAPSVIDQPEIVVATGATLDTAPPALAPSPPETAPEQPSTTTNAPPPPTALYRPPTRPAASPPSADTSFYQPHRRTSALKALHWVQFATLALFPLATIAAGFILGAPDPMTVIVGIGLPLTGAAITVRNLRTLDRDPHRARSRVFVTQAVMLGFAAILISMMEGMGFPGPLLRFVLGAFVANSVVLLGLTALSHPPDLTPQWRGLGSLRATLATQLGMLLVIVPLLSRWWIDLAAGDESPLGTLDLGGATAFFTVMVTTVAALAMLTVAVTTVFARTPMTAARKAGIYGSQGVWLAVAVWYTVPWLYDPWHRFLPTYLTSDQRDFYFGGTVTSWESGGLLPYNIAALWLTVVIGALAVVVISQLRRMPADADTRA